MLLLLCQKPEELCCQPVLQLLESAIPAQTTAQPVYCYRLTVRYADPKARLKLCKSLCSSSSESESEAESRVSIVDICFYGKCDNLRLMAFTKPASESHSEALQSKIADKSTRHHTVRGSDDHAFHTCQVLKAARQGRTQGEKRVIEGACFELYVVVFVVSFQAPHYFFLFLTLH